MLQSRDFELYGNVWLEVPFFVINAGSDSAEK